MVIQMNKVSASRKLIGLATVFSVGLTLVAPERTLAQTAIQEWLSQDTATGNWGHLRDRLITNGVDPELNFTTDLLANPSGGLRQNAAYAGLWYGSTTFDLETIAGIDGLSLYVAGAWAQGRDLSGDDIGNFFGVAQAFNGDVLRLAQVYLERKMLNDRLSVAFGRLSAGDDFATTDAFGYYVNSAVNGNPTGILANAPSFTAPPFAQWGVRATAQPSSDFYFSAGIYNADPDVQNDSEHGLDFTFNPWDGVLALTEVGYTPNTDTDAGGLPGHYAIGAFFDTSEYAFLNDPSRSRSGNFGIYAIAQQMVFREAAGSDQGLTLWGSVNMVPDQKINTLPYALFGGAYYQGLVPNRPNDVTAFGISYGAFSDNLTEQSYEIALELNHRIQAGNWLYVQPTAQYVINPSGGGIPDTLAVGAEISIDF